MKVPFLWSKGIKAGYLDQHTILTSGLTIRDILRQAFDHPQQ